MHTPGGTIRTSQWGFFYVVFVELFMAHIFIEINLLRDICEKRNVTKLLLHPVHENSLPFGYLVIMSPLAIPTENHLLFLR
jgi:hypothetical protein